MSRNRSYTYDYYRQAGRQAARSEYEQAESRRKRDAKRGMPRWARLLGWTVLALLATVAIGATAFALTWQGQYAGKIYPGVRVLDVDLGGKEPHEARKLLNDRMQPFLTQPVVLVWGNREWRPGADQIGLKVYIEATVDEAFAVGRASDIFTGLSQQWRAAQSGYVVPVSVQLSEPALQQYLDSIAATEINQDLFEGDVRLNGAEIVALPGKEGRTLRTYDAIKAVRDSIATLEPRRVDLPVDVVQPTVSAQEVEDIRKQLAVRISGPITATSPVKVFTVDRDALIRFTTIERNPDRSAPRHIELGWKEQELKVLGERWATEAARPPRNARFGWNNGALVVLSESVDGFETTPEEVIKSIKEHSATTDSREYQLPGKVLTPTVSSKDIGALGIRELIGSGSSTFKGSSRERATNIRVAANLLNGTVVPPGSTFSFLDTMGGIDEEHGFVEGYVIAAERTQRGVGGGVCQVSTTMFRAAFWSGLPITERNQHSYRVGWYEADGSPVGFDAAVFDPGVDLKFVNDTPGYLLVEAVVEGETLRVNVYGTKSPSEVRLEGPFISNRTPPPPDVYQVDPNLPPGTKKQVETARAGLDVVIVRRIIRPGHEDKVDRFASAYRAWPNWFIVASASQIPRGADTEPPAPTPNP
jgi:vancomycin resistance protein YoaR